MIAPDLDTPLLETARLVLRRPIDADLRSLVRIANNWAVARQTESLPHPFTLDHGRVWIAGGATADRRFVIAERDSAELVGALGLFVRHEDWEIGFWIAKPKWNQGYATEAVQSAAAFAFDELHLAKLTAAAFADNRAAARVLEKVGFRHLGDLPELLPERGGERMLSWHVADRATLTRS